MKPRDYCCCAIPIFKVGIYTTLTEQFVLGLLVGFLSVTTPSIVGASTPSFAKWLLAIVGFVGAGLQVVGFIGVAQDKPILFRRYVTLHGMILAIGFAIALAWTIISVTKHTTAQTNCENAFFPNDTSSLGSTMCNIFPYVDVGVMGGLIILLGVAQVYFFLVMCSFSSQQENDRGQYDTVYNASDPLKADAIPMNDRADPWDSRPSEELRGGVYGHARNESAASASDILSEPAHAPSDGLSDPNYGFRQGGYPTRQNSQGASVMQPSNAYTQDPQPTPSYHQNSYSTGQAQNTVGMPQNAQIHPAEGSFGRKTPRLTKPNPAAYTENYYKS